MFYDKVKPQYRFSRMMQTYNATIVPVEVAGHHEKGDAQTLTISKRACERVKLVKINCKLFQYLSKKLDDD